ncbi:hypothetical protein GCM10027294_09250 [Marinactinospora endophytica]
MVADVAESAWYGGMGGTFLELSVARARVRFIPVGGRGGLRRRDRPGETGARAGRGDRPGRAGRGLRGVSRPVGRACRTPVAGGARSGDAQDVSVRDAAGLGP